MNFLAGAQNYTQVSSLTAFPTHNLSGWMRIREKTAWATRQPPRLKHKSRFPGPREPANAREDPACAVTNNPLRNTRADDLQQGDSTVTDTDCPRAMQMTPMLQGGMASAEAINICPSAWPCLAPYSTGPKRMQTMGTNRHVYSVLPACQPQSYTFSDC